MSAPRQLVVVAVVLSTALLGAACGGPTQPTGSLRPAPAVVVPAGTPVSSARTTHGIRVSSQHVATAARVAAAAALAHLPAFGGTVRSGETLASSHYCDGCVPPLKSTPKAPVVSTSGSTGLTITPIFWSPAGASAFPGNYAKLVTTYLRDVAAASGSTDNVYSVMGEYYSTDKAGVRHPLRYKITTTPAFFDTHRYPPVQRWCTLTSPERHHCVTDAQVQTELVAVAKARSLPLDLAHLYPVFLAPDVETYLAEDFNSVSAFCGYHSALRTSTGRIAIYGNEPYENPDNCGAGESPNNNPTADSTIDTLSHEISEAMTDPLPNTFPTWRDRAGFEVGDVCAGYYGPEIGFNGDGVDGEGYTAYNQVINGHYYYTQTEFSNAAYRRLGVGEGCLTGEDKLLGRSRGDRSGAGRPGRVVLGSLTNDAFPNTLPADGRSRSSLDVAAATPSNVTIAGDRIHYTTYVIQGRGTCGTLTRHNAVTGEDGHTSVTYRASRSNVVCAIVAKDVVGGQSSTGVIYQGSYRSYAVRATSRHPRSLTAGGRRKTFSVAFENPSPQADRSSRVHLAFFPGARARQNIRAGQIVLSFARHRAGPYHRVTLTGSTVREGAVQGDVLPPRGITIAKRHTLRLFFRIRLQGSVSRHSNADIDLEAYLNQINPGSGAISTFGDTLADPIHVIGR